MHFSLLLLGKAYIELMGPTTEYIFVCMDSLVFNKGCNALHVQCGGYLSL